MGQSKLANLMNGIRDGLSVLAFAVMFYAIFTTLRLVTIVLRKDLLELKWQSKVSYWHVRARRVFDRGRYLKQY
jgi:hypothetical protein